MTIDSSGPQRMTVGIATRMPSASVVPSWACTAAMAISGPGCGGISPCSTDRPASAGMAMRISCRPERWATRTITGSSSTRPISKNIGMPMMMATSAIAHGTSRVGRPRQQLVDHPVRAAGVGQQLAQHRAERDEQPDLLQRGADAGLEVGDDLRQRDAGGQPDERRADDQREERVHLRTTTISPTMSAMPPSVTRVSRVSCESQALVVAAADRMTLVVM